MPGHRAIAFDRKSRKYGILGGMDAVTQLSPFKLAPYFSTRVWGFEDLAPWFDKKAAPGEPIGEAWLTGPASVVMTGELAGENLASAVKKYPQTILGKAFVADAEYPLLIKVLFPREKLSVQVHPDDALAQQKGEPRGKTECWYALEARPDAKVALGLKYGTTPEAVRGAIEASSLEDLLAWVPLSTGDMVFVDAGTVHAIWPGSVILETQQTSDTTYRLYDYGRPRELHVDASLEAMRVATRAGKIARQPGMRGESVLIDEQYFRVERWAGDAAGLSEAGREEHGTQILFVAGGTLRIEGEGGSFKPFTLGRCELAIIPAETMPWQALGEAEVMRMIPKSLSNGIAP
jgi:mannose-6-phosphate isomerase